MIEFVHELKKRQFAPITPTQAAMWPTILSMFALAAIVYLPAALGAGLLQFDDNFFFGPYPDEDPVFPQGAWAVATTPIANAYLPVAHLSLYFDYWLADGAPLLPHLHSLLLHGLCGVVLARLLLQLGVSVVVAHVAAALFVAHPALAESVAWVSSRKSVLSGLFVFLALYQVARFSHRPSVWRWLLLVALAAAAMYSNATAVVLPLIAVGIVLYARGPKQRWLAPLALLVAVVPIALQHRAIAAAEGTLAAGDVASRLPQAPGAFWHYLSTTLWPNGLNVLYPEVATLEAFRESGWLPGLVAFGALLLVALGLWWWRSTRAIAAGLVLFVVALLPFNTAYPASSIAAADRYLYLAVPGLALALVAALQLAHRRAPWFAAALLLPLLWLAGGRAHDFRDDEKLWLASLRADEQNAVAHFNLATSYWNRAVLAGRPLDEACEQHLRAAVRSARIPIHELRARRLLLSLQMASAQYDLAAANARAAVRAAEAQLDSEVSEQRRALAADDLLNARLAAFEPLLLHGDEVAADAVVDAARRQDPEHPRVVAFAAIRELAALKPELIERSKQGLPPRLDDDDPRGQAVDERLAKAREQHPQVADLWLAQALWDRARDRVLPALRGYREAVRIEPTTVSAWLGAAQMLRERGSYQDAVDYAREGLMQRPDPRLRQELALGLVGLNQFDEAEMHMEAYMRLNPDDEQSGKILANLLIGRAYQQLAEGDRAGTAELVERALQYNPDEPKAHLVLGRLAREQRQYLTAVRHLEKACKLMPDFADAKLQFTEALASFGFERMVKQDDMTATEAWLKCREVAPKDFDLAPIDEYLQKAWPRLEQRGVALLGEQDVPGAVAAFRRCLEIDPDQHWAAWLLATALQRTPDCDLDELQRLCEQAVAWQRAHDLDASKQTYLLAETLARKGERDRAREVARSYLEAPSDDAEARVLTALQRLADM